MEAKLQILFRAKEMNMADDAWNQTRKESVELFVHFTYVSI